MKPLILVLLTALTASSLLAQPNSRNAPPPRSGILARGTYRDWNDYLDEVVVVRAARSASIRSVAVSIAASPQLKYPPESENTHRAVREVVAGAIRPFLRGFEEKLNRSGVTVRAGERSAADGLSVRARITRIDPGSQAARYFGSFGAGAAIVEISGEIINERDHSTFIRFRQERRSGFGLGGGGYHALLDRTIRQIGGDIAGLVNAL
jgi:hypothetical protein